MNSATSSRQAAAARSQIKASLLPYEALLKRMDELSRTYPGVSMEFFGESREGRKLPWLHVAGTGKSALLLVSTLHAAELTGGVILLAALEAFLRKRGEGPCEHPTIYLLPRIAVDGSEQVIATGRQLRSGVVPATGSQIEPEDLDGDGLILHMRWPDPEGPFFVPDEDSRMLVVYEEGVTTMPGRRYRQFIEGRIADETAGAPSFTPIGPDFNRVFASEDSIKAEPETAALAAFIEAHPEIAVALDFHNGNPAVFYPGSWLDKSMDSVEHRLGRDLAAIYGMPYVSEYQELFSKVPEKKQTGYFIDWLDARCHIPAFIVEWGLYYNAYGVDLVSHPEALASSFALGWYWQKTLFATGDVHQDNGAFVPWRPFNHPQFGPVEIGGWDYLSYANPTAPEWPALTENTEKVLGLMCRWVAEREYVSS